MGTSSAAYSSELGACGGQMALGEAGARQLSRDFWSRAGAVDSSAACVGGLYDFDSVTGAFTLLVPIEHDKPRHRINDGFVDNAGRLWFGTLHEDCKIEGGALYGWQKDRPVVCHDAGYVVTNGPAVSPDGSALCHTDSGARTVYVFEVSASGTLSRKRPFIHFPEEGVYPDGMAVDSAGHLWIALFNGWRVEQYSAQGNKLDEIRFRVPTSRSLRLAATSCALSMSQQLGPA